MRDLKIQNGPKTYNLIYNLIREINFLHGLSPSLQVAFVKIRTTACRAAS